jgi:hypothetical protein
MFPAWSAYTLNEPVLLLLALPLFSLAVQLVDLLQELLAADPHVVIGLGDAVRVDLRQRMRFAFYNFTIPLNDLVCSISFRFKE